MAARAPCFAGAVTALAPGWVRGATSAVYSIARSLVTTLPSVSQTRVQGILHSTGGFGKDQHTNFVL